MTTRSPGPLIARGRTAEVYAWQDGQILKLFYAWCPPHWVQHEIKIGRAMAGMAVPAPRLIDALKIDGRQGIIYERVDGTTMLRLVNTKPWLTVRLARQLAELHSQIHQQRGVGLAPLRASLRDAIQGVDALPLDLKTGVLALLDRLPDDEALCHFDFHPDQVILTAHGPAVIDWMTAFQGHPLADVARTAVILMVGQAPQAGRAMRALINLWRGLFGRTYLSRYLQLHPGITQADVRTWMIPVAAGRLQEEIQGEKKPLLRLIRSNLPAQGTAGRRAGT